MLRFLSAGESHGRCLVGILEGMVSNLRLSEDDINRELERRQRGYGRGGRMQIEKDTVRLLSGVRGGITTGAPLCMMIKNADHDNWRSVMDITPEASGGERRMPRPGHADLPGIMKYGFEDIRNVIERSSARETAVRVAAGAVCKKFLAEFGINFYSRVVQIGKAADTLCYCDISPYDRKKIEQSDVRSAAMETEMKKEIDNAIETGESLGGIFELTVEGACPGIGSYVQWDRRLDARIAGLLMSIPGIKGVEIGAGFGAISLPGSSFHDQILPSGKKGFSRKTNNAGGIEGGMTNGETIWIKCAMKPIPTLRHPLMSFDIKTLAPGESYYERSDTCAVVPASIVGENFLSLAIAESFLEKFGGDSLGETLQNYRNYSGSISRYWNHA
jgi:chorismate synthase